MADWSYWTVPLNKDTLADPHASERQLDRLGAEGWELVTVVDGVAYLKRPKGQFETAPKLDR